MSILLSITKKMQRYTLFFIIVKALRVSGGFAAHHQCAASKQALHIPDAVCTVLSS
jgi:hypothetical protein